MADPLEPSVPANISMATPVVNQTVSLYYRYWGMISFLTLPPSSN